PLVVAILLDGQSVQRLEALATVVCEALAVPPERGAISHLVLGREAPPELRQDRNELRMQVGAVVALHEVLNDELPVAANFVLDAAADLELVERVAVDRLGIAEWFGYLLHDRALEVGRVVGEADPRISEPLARLPRKQSSFGDLEVGHHCHVRRPDEAPVEPVAPDVVRALEGPRDATLGLVANSGTAVPAHVEESPDLPVGAA